MREEAEAAIEGAEAVMEEAAAVIAVMEEAEAVDDLGRALGPPTHHSTVLWHWAVILALLLSQLSLHV